MGWIDLETGPAAKPSPEIARTRRPRFVSEFETDLRQLYLRMMDEPVPARLLGILRAGLADSKP
jgi:hypothetical protein